LRGVKYPTDTEGYKLSLGDATKDEKTAVGQDDGCMTDDAWGCIFGREFDENGYGGDEEVVCGEDVSRAVRGLTADDVYRTVYRSSHVAHPSLRFAYPALGEGDKDGLHVVQQVEQLGRVVVVEKGDPREWAGAAAKDECIGSIERGESMPGERRTMGGDGGILGTRDILPWRDRRVKGG